MAQTAKIMLVEDDNNLGEIYQARMSAEGYTVVIAHDGEEALAMAAKEKPDLIISDVMMPKISGFEMLDILRNTPGLRDTKVIMLTALSQAEDKSRAQSLGADRYLVKSQVTLEDIVDNARSLLTDENPALSASATAAAPPPAAPSAIPPVPPVAVPPTAPPPAAGQTLLTASQLAQPATPPSPVAPSLSGPPAAPADPITPAPAVPPAPMDPPAAPAGAPSETPPATGLAEPLKAEDPSDNQGSGTQLANPPQPVDPPAAPIPVVPAPDVSPSAPTPPPAAPSAAPPPAQAAANDKLLAGAVDELLANAPKSEAVLPPSAAVPPPAAPATTSTPASTPQATPISREEDDSQIVRNKKVINPINQPSDKPSLNSLLAAEEARSHSLLPGTPGAAASSTSNSNVQHGFVLPAQTSIDQTAHQPGNVFSPNGNGNNETNQTSNDENLNDLGDIKL